MALTSIFQWQNQDSTADLNARFSSTFSRGLLAGGVIVPIPATLTVNISPFIAVSYDGMLVQETVAPVLIIPINQTSIVSVFARYNLGAAPDLSYEVTEASVFNALPDKAYHIVLGAITIAAPPQITVADISLAMRDMVDTTGRSPFRGHLTTSALLPVNSPVGINRPGDFYAINQGVGDLPEIQMWDGVAWQNITNSLAVAADLAAHRANFFVDEKHLTDDQWDAALGSTGLPSLANRYVTQSDPVLPTQAENDALQGSHGSPSGTNRYLTQEYTFAETGTLAFPLPPGGAIEATGVNGPYYVGTGLVGSANTFFALWDFTLNQGYVNSILIAPIITGVFTDSLLVFPLDPSTDINVDSEGFFTGSLYLQVSSVVDTAFRIAFGRRRTAGTLSRSFTIGSNPGDEFLPSQTIEKIVNIKGRAFTSAVPTREQNINLRLDLDYTTSYLGSVLNTNVVADNEDFLRLQDEPVIGSNFVKNVGIPDILTFSNAGLASLAYSPITGTVLYGAAVGLGSVVPGNLFRDGVGRYFLVVAVGVNSVDIISVDTGLIPSTINTSVGTSIDGSIKKNNNPRDLLLSEMKYSQGDERFPVYSVTPKNDEYSKPDGKVAWGLLKADGRFEPRIVFYGAFENYTSSLRESYVRCAGLGEIQVTGFLSSVVLLLRRKSAGPNLSVSVNEEVATLVSTAVTSGATVNPGIGNTRGNRYQRLVVASGLDPTVPTTVSIEVLTPTADSLDVYGVLFVRSASATLGFLESGVAFQNTSLIKRNLTTGTVPSPALPAAYRGGRSIVAVGNNSYQIGNFILDDVDGTTPPSGTSTGLTITGVVSSKLAGYRAGDLILIGLTGAPFTQVIRKILSIVGTTVTVDTNTGFLGACAFYLVCSLDNSIPNTDAETETARYLIPTDFDQNLPGDFELPDPQDRFVVHTDGLTTLAGTNISVITTGFSGAPKAAKINSGGHLKILVFGTRLDIVTNNTSAATVDVTIDGSPTQSFSIPGTGAARRTIFFNGRYQTHEVVLTPTVGDLVISEMIFFAPFKPQIASQPNVVADLPLPAVYIPSSANYTLAPNVYPMGATFYEGFSNITFFNGTGANPDWLVTNTDFAQSPYGRYLYTENDASSIRFQFLGTAFELQYLTGASYGRFKMQVDGIDLDLTGATIVGDYTGNYVDGLGATGRENIGAYGFTYGWHEVRAYIESPRTTSGVGYLMAFTGYWVGNVIGAGTGPLALGLNREGVFTSVVDDRNFIPQTQAVAADAATSDGITRAQRVGVTIATTSLIVVFSSPMPDTNYAINTTWVNTVDPTPLYQPINVAAYSLTGMTLTWNTPVDSANYVISYNVTPFS